MRTQDVREITSISAARSWAERGEREQEVSAWRARRQLDGCPGLQKCFHLGTAAAGAAPPRPTNYERVVSELGELLKARPEPARAERRE